MVGVPGRSKACNTCRQRKVSCSLEKPECRTCMKSSRVCTGYQRERIFLLDQRTACGGQKVYRKPVPQNTTVLTERKRKALPKSKAEITDRSKIVGREQSPDAMAVSRVGNFTSLSPYTAYRQQILSDLILTTIPKSPPSGENSSKEFQSDGWFGLLPSLPNMTTALESSILSIAVARIGRINNEPALVHESLKLYTKGLVDLQQALWNPKLMHRDETLAACMSLVFYEVIECPGRSVEGWQSHIRACSKLFELKGADAYTSKFGHELFLTFRLLEIQLALSERRPTYLAHPVWIKRPWIGRAKSSFHEFLDLMVMLPNQIADGYRLIEPVLNSQCLDFKATLLGLMGLVDRSWKLDNELRAFYTKLEQTNLGPLYWPKLSQITEADDGKKEMGTVFPVSFHFANPQMAHLCMLYWATSSILWSGMSYSYALLSSFHVDMSAEQYPPLEHRTDIASLSRNICQSIEYCTLDENKSLGTSIVAFPMKVAIEALNDCPGCERELDWANATMAKVASVLQIMGNLPCSMTDHAYLPG